MSVCWAKEGAINGISNVLGRCGGNLSRTLVIVIIKSRTISRLVLKWWWQINGRHSNQIIGSNQAIIINTSSTITKAVKVCLCRTFKKKPDVGLMHIHYDDKIMLPGITLSLYDDLLSV